MRHRPPTPQLGFDATNPEERSKYARKLQNIWIHVVHAEVAFLRSMFHEYRSDREIKVFVNEVLRYSMDTEIFERWTERLKNRAKLTSSEVDVYVSHICTKHFPGHWFRYILIPPERMENDHLPSLVFTPEGIAMSAPKNQAE
jgi:hypothetical protein